MINVITIAIPITITRIITIRTICFDTGFEIFRHGFRLVSKSVSKYFEMGFESAVLQQISHKTALSKWVSKYFEMGFELFRNGFRNGTWPDEVFKG